MKQKRGLTASPTYSFSGGLVTMVAKTRLLPSQLIRARNINLLVNGEWEVRKGFSKVSTVAFGTTIDRFIHFKTESYDKIIAYGGADVKRLDTGAPDVWTSLSSGMTDTEEYRSLIIAQGRLYLADTAGVKKYVGGQSVLWNAGIAAPAGALTAADGGAGSLTGTYTWYYTHYNSVTGEESDPNPLSNELTVAAKQVTLSGFATGDAQADKQRIYRNLNGVSGHWYLVTERATGAGNYTDNTVDDNLGIELLFTNAVPPASKILLYHMNRLFYVDKDNPSKLMWSEPFRPGSVPYTNYWYIEKGDGGVIVAIIASYGNIIVLKNTGVFCFFFNPTDPTQSYYMPLAQKYGCNAPMTVENVQGEIVFLSSEGLKKITNGGTQISDIEIAVPSDSGSAPISAIANILRACNVATVSRAVGAYYEKRNQYHISVPYYGSNNDLTLVWCIDGNAFVTHEGFDAKAMGMYRYYDSELLYRSHNDEYIYYHDNGYTDNGTSISFDVQTGFHDVDGNPDKKRIRLFFPIIFGADDAQISCEIVKDFEAYGSGFVTTLTHEGASYWGSAHWGYNYWGASGEALRRVRARVKGRLFSTRFYGTTDRQIGCSGYQFYYQPKAL